MPTVAETQLCEAPFDQEKTHKENMHELLSFWVGLSDAQKRTFQVLTNEIETASTLVETSIEALSKNFVELARFTQHQVQELNSIIEATDEVEVENDLFSEDISNNILARDKIQKAMASLRRENNHLRKAIINSAQKSNSIANKFSEIIIGIQFQDRTSQRLCHVTDTLLVLSEAGNQMIKKSEGCLNLDGKNRNGRHELDREWLSNLVSKFELGETRERYIMNAFYNTSDLVADDSDESGCDQNGCDQKGNEQNNFNEQEIELF